MLQRIVSFQQIKDLKEIILGKDESRESYKVMYVDETSIKLVRRGDYSRLRILHIDSILHGDWYFESDKGITDIRSNNDSQLLNKLNNREEKEEG